MDVTQASQLSALIDVSQAVNTHLDLDDVLAAIMSVTTRVLQAEASSLALIDESTGDLLFHVTEGDAADSIKSIRIKPGQGVVGWVVAHNEAAVVNDVANDQRFFSGADDESGFVTRSILCVPMATPKKPWGAIEVLNKRGGPFTDSDLELCHAIAAQAAIAVENAILHRQIVQNERLAAIGQTVAGLAHCIKNVLNGIQGGSYMVDSALQKENPERMAKGWGIVKKNNRFLQDLVMDMLTYSKERKPERAPCDVNEITAAVCGLMEEKAKQKGVTLTSDLGTFQGPILMDGKQIRRCLLNLVSNAVDACPEDGSGRVTVTTEPGKDDRVLIRTGDNGCGISEEDQQKLFKVFFSTKGSRGTGLGLAVTQKIVNEHGGTIHVASSPGAGSEFTIDLPRLTEIESDLC